MSKSAATTNGPPGASARRTRYPLAAATAFQSSTISPDPPTERALTTATAVGTVTAGRVVTLDGGRLVDGIGTVGALVVAVAAEGGVNGVDDGSMSSMSSSTALSRAPRASHRRSRPRSRPRPRSARRRPVLRLSRPTIAGCPSRCPPRSDWFLEGALDSMARVGALDPFRRARSAPRPVRPESLVHTGWTAIATSGHGWRRPDGPRNGRSCVRSTGCADGETTRFPPSPRSMSRRRGRGGPARGRGPVGRRVGSARGGEPRPALVGRRDRADRPAGRAARTFVSQARAPWPPTYADPFPDVTDTSPR